MLVAIQYPLVDSRNFLAGANRLVSPIWPHPAVHRNRFVRSFGPVRNRPRGGIDGWVGEGTICDAHRALQLTRLPLADTPIGRSRQLHLAFRRFYADGRALAKLEIGFGTIPRSVSSPELIGPALDAVLGCPVRITCGREATIETELRSAGYLIARKYLYASTERSYVVPPLRDSWFVRAGQPLALIETRGEENEQVTSLAKGFRRKTVGNLDVAHGYWPPGNRPDAVRVWSIRATGRAARDKARGLRIVLARLHAEQQAFHAVLEHIATRDELHLREGPEGSPEAALLSYVNQARRIVLEQEKTLAAAGGAQLIELAKEIEDAVLPGDRESLLRQLENVRSTNLRRSLQGYVKDNTATKSAIFISYAHSDPPEHLKLLKTHLRAYTRAHQVRAWSDKDIDPGSNWRAEIDRAMGEAEIAILLVTPNFLASDFIADVELPRLHQRAHDGQLRLFWLPISHSAYKTTVLKDYQAMWSPTEPLDTRVPTERDRALVSSLERAFGD